MAGTSLWLTAAASVQGPGHLKFKLPNQDAFVVQKSSDGSVIAVVVSDGAGSAPHSERGSRVCAEIMGTVLLAIGEKYTEQITGAFRGEEKARQFIQDRVAKGLRRVREELDPTEGRLSEFHHTFTGAVLTPVGGFMAQIGDSPAVTARAEEVKNADKPDLVDFFAKNQIHLAEKGEYVNETCFVTQSLWLQNLHLVLIPANTALLLMSDGAGDLVMSRGEIFRPFIANVFSRVLKEQNSAGRDHAILESLSDPRADEITADDKTLVIVCPWDWQRLADAPYVDEDGLVQAGSASLPSARSPAFQPSPKPRPGFSIQVMAMITLLAFGIGVGVGGWGWDRAIQFLASALKQENDTKGEVVAAPEKPQRTEANAKGKTSVSAITAVSAEPGQESPLPVVINDHSVDISPFPTPLAPDGNSTLQDAEAGKEEGAVSGIINDREK